MILDNGSQQILKLEKLEKNDMLLMYHQLLLEKCLE